jgi:hypothetical protein
VNNIVTGAKEARTKNSAFDCVYVIFHDLLSSDYANKLDLSPIKSYFQQNTFTGEIIL